MLKRFSVSGKTIHMSMHTFDICSVKSIALHQVSENSITRETIIILLQTSKKNYFDNQLLLKKAIAFVF